MLLGIKAQDLGDLLISDKEAYDKAFEVVFYDNLIIRNSIVLW